MRKSKYLVTLRVDGEVVKVIAKPAYPTRDDAIALVRTHLRELVEGYNSESEVVVIDCFRITS